MDFQELLGVPLVLVPVVYEFVDDFENWLKPKLARLVTPREAPADRAEV